MGEDHILSSADIISEKTAMNRASETIFESKSILNAFYSVQFSINDNEPLYLFKLRNSTLNGLCILIKENSSVLNYLKVGDVLSMEYNPHEWSVPTKLLKTRITSKNPHDSLAGHSLIELSILDKPDDHSLFREDRN